MKFAGWNFDVFFSGHLVLLMHFQIAGQTIEIPGCSLLERCGNHCLWRIKLDQFAIKINSRPTGYSMVIDRHKVCIGDCTSAVHFELEKLLAVDVLHSIKMVEYW